MLYFCSLRIQLNNTTKVIGKKKSSILCFDFSVFHFTDKCLKAKFGHDTKITAFQNELHAVILVS